MGQQHAGGSVASAQSLATITKCKLARGAVSFRSSISIATENTTLSISRVSNCYSCHEILGKLGYRIPGFPTREIPVALLVARYRNMHIS